MRKIHPLLLIPIILIIIVIAVPLILLAIVVSIIFAILRALGFSTPKMNMNTMGKMFGKTPKKENEAPKGSFFRDVPACEDVIDITDSTTTIETKDIN